MVEQVLRVMENDGAGLGILALGKEGEVLVANLLNLEEATLGADSRLLQVFHPVVFRRLNDGDVIE